MPGIAGIVQTDPTSGAEAPIAAMLDSMRHEPFYQAGTHTEPSLGVCAGWAGFHGLIQWNRERDRGLIFSGETFSDSGTQNVLESYEQFGDSFARRLNGWFSGLIIDVRDQKTILFNDRYGLARVYYHETPDAAYFSSEAKALLRVLPELRRFDTAGLSEFFTCGCVLQNRSLFQGVSLLPGGSIWTFYRGGKVRKEKYFDASEWENQPRLQPEEFYQRVKEIFPGLLKRYLPDDEHAGISMTGGVDSRMILAWVQRPPGKFPCYTFGGPYRDSIDVKVARQAAEICGQPHQVIEVGDKFLAEFPTLAERTVYLTDGVMDVSGAADLYVNRFAREIAPVRMTGNYGGEILREGVAFKPATLYPEVFSPEFTPSLRGARGTYAGELQNRKLSFVAFKQVPWHHYSRLSLEWSQITMRSPYLDNDLVKLTYQAPAASTSTNEVSLRMIADGNPALGRLSTDRGILPRSLPLLSTANNAFQEFLFKAEYAYDYGMPQWLARADSYFKPLHLERLFLGRHKFHHFRVYYRDRLANYLKEVLLDARSLGRPYLNGRVLETMVRDHTTGRRNYTLEIHRILTAELTQRLLLD